MESNLLEPRRREEGLNRRCLVVLHLDGQNSPGHEPGRCFVDHLPNDVEAVLSATERRRGFVIANIRGTEIEFSIADVRRIGDDEVEARCFLGGQWLVQGSNSDIDAIRMKVAGDVPLRQPSSCLDQFGRDDARLDEILGVELGGLGLLYRRVFSVIRS